MVIVLDIDQFLPGIVNGIDCMVILKEDEVDFCQDLSFDFFLFSSDDFEVSCFNCDRTPTVGMIQWLSMLFWIGPCIFSLKWACWIKLDMETLILPLFLHVLITKERISWSVIQCFNCWLFSELCCSESLYNGKMVLRPWEALRDHYYYYLVKHYRQDPLYINKTLGNFYHFRVKRCTKHIFIK